MKYHVEYKQVFDITDEVEADSPEEAWRKVLDGVDTKNVDQSPAEIIFDDDDEDDHFVRLVEDLWQPDAAVRQRVDLRRL